MEDKEQKTVSWHKKSRAVLLKLLNNVGLIGAILAAILDIIFVIIMVMGVDIHANMKSVIIFSVVNALIGLLINFLLRYQGKRYAELENEELCAKFYKKKVKEKKYMSMGKWMTIKTVEDFIIKGCTTAFSVFGIIYITITGSKNPIQILITIATLVLFACFGLMSMNSAYCRFYEIQLPFMENEIEKVNKCSENKVKKTKKKKIQPEEPEVLPEVVAEVKNDRDQREGTEIDVRTDSVESGSDPGPENERELR